jgi:hypothetical protein
MARFYSYRLIAYDIASSQQAFNENVDGALSRPSAGENWKDHKGNSWHVVRVWPDSTEQEVRIDVKKVGSILTK